MQQQDPPTYNSPTTVQITDECDTVQPGRKPKPAKQTSDLDQNTSKDLLQESSLLPEDLIPLRHDEEEKTCSDRAEHLITDSHKNHTVASLSNEENVYVTKAVIHDSPRNETPTQDQDSGNDNDSPLHGNESPMLVSPLDSEIERINHEEFEATGPSNVHSDRKENATEGMYHNTFFYFW